jgi:hypothetical protein
MLIHIVSRNPSGLSVILLSLLLFLYRLRRLLRLLRLLSTVYRLLFIYHRRYSRLSFVRRPSSYLYYFYSPPIVYIVYLLHFVYLCHRPFYT